MARKVVRHWPGMPTSRSQGAESFVVIVPVVVGVAALILLTLVAVLRHLLSN